MKQLTARSTTATAGSLAVMMPVYNEERTLPHILQHVLARPEVGEVIAVDDGSTDASWDILRNAAASDRRLRPVRQPVNRGKGAALRVAISELTKQFALVQDADLELDPADYPALLQPLVAGRTDAVFGVRQFGGQGAHSYWFVKGSQGLSWIFNVLNNCYVRDVLTGYKALRSELWQRLHLTRDGFDVDPEIAAKLIRLGYRIHEVPISYYARSRRQGKKVTARDGLVTVSTMLAVRFGDANHLFGGDPQLRYHRQRQEQLERVHPLVVLASPREAPRSENAAS